jgi:hypothetical protein
MIHYQFAARSSTVAAIIEAGRENAKFSLHHIHNHGGPRHRILGVS